MSGHYGPYGWMEDPEPNWTSLEETPKAYPESEPLPPVTGNTAECYACGIDLRKLHDNLAVRKHYGTKHRFENGCFITLCIWCDHDFRST